MADNTMKRMIVAEIRRLADLMDDDDENCPVLTFDYRVEVDGGTGCRSTIFSLTEAEPSWRRGET